MGKSKRFYALIGIMVLLGVVFFYKYEINIQIVKSESDYRNNKVNIPSSSMELLSKSLNDGELFENPNGESVGDEIEVVSEVKSVNSHIPINELNNQTQIVLVSNDEELGKAIASFKEGTVIALKPGNYSKIFLKPSFKVGEKTYGNIPKFKGYLTITSLDKENKAIIETIDIRVNNIHVKGLEIIGTTKKYSNVLYVQEANNIIIEGNEIHYGNSDDWTSEDWLEKAHNGVGIRSGDNIKVIDNYIHDVATGVNLNTPNSEVSRNTINRFRGDGIRVNGNHSIASNNFVKNSIKADDNHDDCIQAWSQGENGKSGQGVLSDVIISGNVCIMYDDENNPLYGREMQGIGLFDGFYKNFTIENNLILTSMYHGITVLGGENVEIRNNVSMDIDDNDTGYPWIRIQNHKDGRVSINSLIENNISSASFTSGSGVTQNNNLVIPMSKYKDYFINPDKFNFTLKNEFSEKKLGLEYISAGSNMYPFDIEDVLK